MATDQTVAVALRDIILALDIVPAGTANTANVGDTTVTLTSAQDAAQFCVGGELTFADTNGEESLTISKISGAALTLDFSGLGYTGLQYAHAAETLVFTNLLDYAPVQVGAMIAKGAPAIWIATSDEQDALAGTRQVQGTYTVHIQYHRQLMIPPTSPMAPNRWADRQQKAARADLATISTALENNWRLVTPNQTPQAEALGDRSGARPYLTKAWRRLTNDLDTQQFVAAMDVVVRAPRTTMTTYQ